jgi:hypothetical protein
VSPADRRWHSLSQTLLGARPPVSLRSVSRLFPIAHASRLVPPHSRAKCPKSPSSSGSSGVCDRKSRKPPDFSGYTFDRTRRGPSAWSHPFAAALVSPTRGGASAGLHWLAVTSWSNVRHPMAARTSHTSCWELPYYGLNPRLRRRARRGVLRVASRRRHPIHSITSRRRRSVLLGGNTGDLRTGHCSRRYDGRTLPTSDGGRRLRGGDA